MEDYKAHISPSEMFKNMLDPNQRAEAIVEERDVILLNSLRNKTKGNKVVGIVGRKHLTGIQRYWDSLEDRIDELGLDRGDFGL